MTEQFKFGEIVYLITDPEQMPRMVIGINLRPSGTVYVLSCGTEECQSFAIEMSKERGIV